MQDTNFKQFVGVAATSIDNNNDRILEVYCQEFSPFKHGVDGRASFSPSSVKIEDAETGANVPVDVTLSNTIECEYLGSNTNLDVPDIHIGEMLLITNFCGDEKFYWSCMDRKDHIRHVEHFRLGINDERKTNKEIHDDNTYYIDLDTRKHKRILLSTANSDGEKYRYFIHMDAVKNQLTINDDAGNIIQIESDIPRIHCTNGVGCSVDLNAVDLLINVPRDMITNVGRDYTLTTGNNYTRTTLMNEITKSKTHTQTVDDALIVTAGKYTRVSKEHGITGDKYVVAAKGGNVVCGGISLGII